MKKVTVHQITKEIRYYGPKIKVTENLQQKIELAVSETELNAEYLTTILEKSMGDIFTDSDIYEISKNLAAQYAL